MDKDLRAVSDKFIHSSWSPDETSDDFISLKQVLKQQVKRLHEQLDLQEKTVRSIVSRFQKHEKTQKQQERTILEQEAEIKRQNIKIEEMERTI